MTKPYDIIAFGDTCVDLILRDDDVVPRFGQVEKIVADYEVVMGGSCCIFAAQAAKLGLKTALLGRVGDDAFGQLILDTLRSAGVDTRFVTRDKTLKTGLTLHLVQGDDRAMLTHFGSLNTLTPDDVTDEFLESARHLHYGSLYLHTGLLPGWIHILERAKKHGLSISLDTNWDPNESWDVGLAAAAPYVNILLPNEQEALHLSQQSELEKAVQALRRQFSLLAVKLGADGAIAFHQQDEYFQAVQAADVGGDGIGAGDSFDAGFVAGWLRGLPIDSCLSIACQCGRAVAGKVGGTAGQLSRAAIPELRAASRG